jgi:hypothetical protein
MPCTGSRDTLDRPAPMSHEKAKVGRIVVGVDESASAAAALRWAAGADLDVTPRRAIAASAPASETRADTTSVRPSSPSCTGGSIDVNVERDPGTVNVTHQLEIGPFTFGEITADPFTGRPINPVIRLREFIELAKLAHQAGGRCPRRITSHPISFRSGEWTCAIGEFDDGSRRMVTVAKWRNWA